MSPFEQPDGWMDEFDIRKEYDEHMHELEYIEEMYDWYLRNNSEEVLITNEDGDDVYVW